MATISLKVRTKLFGAEGMETLSSMAMLGLARNLGGRRKEAEALEVEVRETRKKKPGADHPNTLTSMANLAGNGDSQGETRSGPSRNDDQHGQPSIDVHELMSECVRLSRHILGASHPHYMSFSKTLAGWEAAGEGWLLDLRWLIMFILFSFIF